MNRLIFDPQLFDEIRNYNSDTVISGSSDDDTVYNYGSTVVVYGYGGADVLGSTSGVYYVTLSGGDYSDAIVNLSSYSSLSGGSGDDMFLNQGSYVTVNGGSGDDYITLDSAASGNLIQYADGDGDDTIEGFNSDDTLQITSGTYSTATSDGNLMVYVGSNVIVLEGVTSANIVGNSGGGGGGGNSDGNYNYNDNTVISGTSDADTIFNSEASNVTIRGYGGNDVLFSYGGSNVVIDGGDGTDGLASSSTYSSLNGGSGNDVIFALGNYSTVVGGYGSDNISLDSSSTGILIQYADGDGSDTIEGFNSDDTLQITSGTYSTAVSGNNLLVTVGSGVITLVGVTSANISGNQSDGSITNNNSNTVIGGTSDADTIINYGSNVVVHGYGGSDYMFSFGGNNVTLDGGESADGLGSTSPYSSLSGGNGNDVIISMSDYSTVNGGAGADTIDLNYEDYTAGYNVVQYANGDGNDYIQGFNSDDTLQITSGEYSTAVSGSNLLVTVGSGVITLEGVTVANISGTQKVENSWTVSGTTAYYGTPSNTIITVSGLSSGTSASNLSLSGNTVTVNPAALTNTNVTITNGYNLALGSGTPTPISTAGGWTVSGTTATYSSSGTTAGYTLINNQIIYTSASNGSILTTITGLSFGTSSSNLSLNGTTVTVNAAALTSTTVTISNGYSLALAADVVKSLSSNAKWTKSGTTATYKTAGTTAGYKLSSDSKTITYANAKTGSTLVTLTGLKSGSSTDGLSIDTNKKTVSIKASQISSSSAVSVKSAGYTYTIDGKGKLVNISGGAATLQGSAKADTLVGGAKADYLAGNGGNDSLSGGNGNDKLFGGAGADTLLGGKGADTLNGGAGNDTLTGGDGNDLFVFNGGKDVITDYKPGKDKISVSGSISNNVTYSGKDVIFKIGTGTLKVKNGSGKKITINGKTQTYSPGSDLPTGLSYNADKTVLSVLNTYSNNKIDLADYSQNTTKVNASRRTKAISIVGNAKNNSLVGGSKNDTLDGGKGNDILTGGAGKDKFLHTSGNDVITDYQVGKDKIYLINTEIIGAKLYVNDVILTTDNGSITLENMKGKKITVVDSDGHPTTKTYGGLADGLSYSKNNTVLIASNSFGEENIDLADYDPAVKTVNASAVSDAVNITGNRLSNSLVGGKGDDILYGYTGSDTLTGGDGADIFVHSDGNDVITDYISGKDKIQLDGDTEILSWEVGKNDVTFKTTSGTLKVQNGKGRKLTIVDGEGHETVKAFSTSSKNVADMWFAEENNFATSVTIDDIGDIKKVGEIEFATAQDTLQAAAVTFAEK